ncbi:hypothetical protein [Tepidibacter formicigenes]|uniref:Uncharacterized protein n=1 Tax=Tepidibacter formicigenes DSM 15518 TaxID=1123349 RepID=A0A1M6QPW9_9FIRM|nr:hypothetical protein [Tepidibacter formicigenes]SHK22133.1 hypothetical protein SAMN02744037_01908 [Tepidibacter formicigenes DSM 15518]
MGNEILQIQNQNILKSKLVNCIKTEVLKLGVLENELSIFEREANCKEVESLKKSLKCYRILNKVNFKLDIPGGGYVYSILKDPSLSKAKNKAIYCFIKMYKVKFEDILNEIASWSVDISTALELEDKVKDDPIKVKQCEEYIEDIEYIYEVFENKIMDLSLYQKGKEIYNRFKEICG